MHFNRTFSIAGTSSIASPDTVASPSSGSGADVLENLQDLKLYTIESHQVNLDPSDPNANSPTVPDLSNMDPSRVNPSVLNTDKLVANLNYSAHDSVKTLTASDEHNVHDTSTELEWDDDTTSNVAKTHSIMENYDNGGLCY